jgi:hypothetical protein
MTTTARPQAPDQDLLLAIARKHAPGIETLETRNSDRLDFHDISAAAIRGMLRDAFELGIAAALDNNKRSR